MDTIFDPIYVVKYPGEHTTISEILKIIKEKNIEFIDFKFADLFGRLHHYTQTADKAEADGTKPPAMLYRKGRGFYTLRHVFETIGGESCDQVAVDAIMGHERGDMADVYRERISDERLHRVVNTVREWLFAEADEPSEGDEPAIVPFRTVG